VPLQLQVLEGDYLDIFRTMGIATGSVVQVFTNSGHHVKTLPRSDNTVTWDLTNESMDQVASGMYLYVITAGNGQQGHGTLAIIH